MTNKQYEQFKKNLKEVILPVGISRTEYLKVINYLITIGCFKDFINNDDAEDCKASPECTCENCKKETADRILIDNV